MVQVTTVALSPSSADEHHPGDAAPAAATVDDADDDGNADDDDDGSRPACSMSCGASATAVYAANYSGTTQVESRRQQKMLVFQLCK